MADPHNPARYGETWKQHRIDAYLEVCTALKHSVVFSGGWAWHFLSPAGHQEFRHAHDHSDMDLMVPPITVQTVMGILQGLGFGKVRTKYDRLPSDEGFRRYEKAVTRYVCHGKVSEEPHQCFCMTDSGDDECFTDEFRLTIDFFVKGVPALQCPGGWFVVRPKELLDYYSTIHSSNSCWAVVAAQRLLGAGASEEKLIGHPELLGLEHIKAPWACG